MTYAMIPRSMGASFSGAMQSGIALAPEINSSVPQLPGMPALGTPDQTALQIMASSPQAAEIEGDWAPAINAAASIGMPPAQVMKDPGAATSFMLQAMPAVMQAAGISGTAADIAQVAAGYAPEVGALVDGHPGPLIMAGVKTAVGYGCQQLGIPPDIGTMTIDAIRSGELSDQTVEAAGGLGGSIGGSALCSLVGIPPCIGGYAGGIAGKAIGGFIADVAGIGLSKSERKARHDQQKALEQQAAGELDAIRNGMISVLMQARPSWWAKFDSVIDAFSAQWQAAECNASLGMRFPLLWSGRGTVNPYFMYPYMTSTCTIPLNRNLSRGTGCLNSKGLLTSVTEAGCPEPYGCPYPALPIVGAPDPFSARVIQAFAAYDIWWVQPTDRSKIDQMWVDSFSKPNDFPKDDLTRTRGAFAARTWAEGIAELRATRKKCSTNKCKAPIDAAIAKGFETYKAQLGAELTQALSLEAINAAAMRISTDLTTTAAIYTAAQQINAQRSQGISKNYTRLIATQQANADAIMRENDKLREAVTKGRIINGIINYGSLALGGALLFKAVRR